MRVCPDINNLVPFYSNTADDAHCFQAAIRMVLKYFYSNEEYSWGKLDTISAKVKDLWTWPTVGLIWLKDKGLYVKVISPFDYKSFINQGGEFIVKKYGKEVGDAQVTHSDIAQEKVLAQEILRKVSIIQRIPDLNEIFRLLQDNSLIICNINSQILNKGEGYIGHFVVVKGIRDRKLIIHDPGLPPQENREVAAEDFESAWSYPNEDAKDIYAFRRNDI